MAKKINQKANAKPAPVAPVPSTAPAAAASTAKTTRKWSATTWLCIILAAVALLVYGNTLVNGYVLDDNVVTTKNTIVRQGFAGIPELLQTPRMKGVAYFKNDNYRPLSLVMLAVEYELFGDSASVSHLFNILFFAGCMVFLFLFLDKLFGRQKTMVAFLATLLFTIHPIHTEVVANIKSRDEIMCFFFGFLALNLFMDYMHKAKIWQLLLGTVLLFLSFLSKETVITFLFIVPLVFFFYQAQDRKRAIAITAGTVLAAGVYLAIRHVVLTAFDCSTGAVEFIDNALVRAPNIASRIATAILVLGYYVKLLFWPHPLNNDYCFNSIPYVGFDNIWVLLTTVLYVGSGILAVYLFLKDRKSPWAFAILFYLSSLVLFSNIPFLIGSQMGERFVFFASVGFCLLAALAIEKWLTQGPLDFPDFFKNKKVLALMVPICLVFTGLTVARNSDWKDNYTLFSTDLAKSPNDSRLYFYLGVELVEGVYPTLQDPVKQKETLRASITNLQSSLRIFPEFADAETELGKAYFMIPNYDSAALHFKNAIALSPYQSIAANNLGTVYMRTGKYREAIDAYKLALQIRGNFTDVFFNMGCCYAQTKQYDSALYNLNMALALDPNYSPAYYQIGMVYYLDNKLDAAVPPLKKALEFNQNNVDALNTLGAVYLNAGKLPEALEQFKKVVALNPNYVYGHSNMGHCLYQMKQYQAAIEALNKVMTLDPNHVNDIPFIALSYKGLGNMELAKKYEAIAKQYYSNFSLDAQ